MEIEYLLVGIFSVLFILFSLYANEKRTEELRAAAKRLHCSFSPNGKNLSLDSLPSFHLFSLGRLPNISNVLHKSIENGEVWIFKYTYATGYGKNLSRHSQTVLLFDSKALTLPTFIVCPENILCKLGQIFGCQDVDIGTHPKFSEEYWLKGDDEARIRQHFNHQTLAYYEKNLGLTTEGSGRHLIIYNQLRIISSKKIDEFLEQGIEIAELFKIGTKSRESLLAELSDERSQIRKDTARALGFFHDDYVSQALHTLLSDSDAEVRQAAVWALGTARDARNIPALLHALEDIVENVRQEAVTALNKACPVVRVVMFGQKNTFEPRHEHTQSVLNPDVSNLSAPMSSLRRIIIDSTTHDFHMVERFLTYAINALSQNYLKYQVNVDIIGNPEELHVNLWNTINNLFEHVHVHNNVGDIQTLSQDAISNNTLYSGSLID